MIAAISRLTTDPVDVEHRLRLAPERLQWLDRQVATTSASDPGGSRSTAPDVQKRRAASCTLDIRTPLGLVVPRRNSPLTMVWQEGMPGARSAPARRVCHTRSERRGRVAWITGMARPFR